MIKKVMGLLTAAVMALGVMPGIAVAAAPEYSASRLRAAGEELFIAPDPQDTSIFDRPVADYWPGWTVDGTHATVNYRYYGDFGDCVVQFYRDGKGTDFTKDESFFENAQSNTGKGRLIAPGDGLGRGEDFIVLDYNLKIGDAGVCYHDYYFRDAEGRLILAVRYDINGVFAAVSANDMTDLGAILERDVSAVQPFSLAFWNSDGRHTVLLEQDGNCIYTNTLDGELNGFGGIDVYIGYYNGDVTHTGIGGLKITGGSFDGMTPEKALAAIDIPYNIDGSIDLPKEIFGRKIGWSALAAAGDSTVYTTVTAEIDGKKRDFDIMFMGKNDNIAAAYTKDGDPLADSSMHLALRTADGWRELNFGLGVLFAGADLEDGTPAGTTRILKKPWLYRTAEGKIAVAATTCYIGGGNERLELWETDDLVHFTPVTGEAEGYANADRVRLTGINGKVTGLLDLTEDEAAYLEKKLGEVTNTSVDPVRVVTKPGTAVTELPGLTAHYSDGSTEVIPVEWNGSELASIDFNKAGVYTVRGRAAVADYPSPMITGRADPVIYNYNGKYYFIATDETGGQKNLYLRESDTVDGLASAQDNLIFQGRPSGDMSGCNWAPELHVIGGKLRCLFASGTRGTWDSVQSRIMTCDGDPKDIKSWSEPVRVTKADGSELITNGITLDMTYFEADGKHYYCWAERPIDALGIGNSQLVIAETDPADPTKITTAPSVIRVPSFAWDRQTATVDEGPNVLVHDNKLYMTFSGSGVDPTYRLGLLTAEVGANLLDPDSWTVSGYPVLDTVHVDGEPGPGHNSFAKDEYGRDIIVVHYMPAGTNHRNMTVRTVHYGFDGEPILYMTADRYLRPEYRDVTATVYVDDGAAGEDELELEGILARINIPNPENVRGNITLPTESEGAEISWSSSDPAISPDGVVTRGDTDKKVILTATAVKNGKTATRTYELVVKAKPAEKEKAGYLYAYFRGSVNGEQEVQQIHLAVSDDGLNWRDLNGNFPVIESTMGTMGLRDPYIIRSHEGDRFYLMATDLDSNGGDWASYGSDGSKYLMFWESDDLVNWSEQRMIKVSDDRMGCTWAPEAIYDEENGEYLIYWASYRTDLGQKVIQCARTRDFRTFTEPEIFMGTEYSSVIDTTMIRGGDGKYYRFTKEEEPARVFMEAADSLDGPYIRVNSNIESITGVEGPGIFRMTDGRYCLMLDGYMGANAGVGFFPLVTDDLASGNFQRLTSGYRMPTGAKHGAVIPITGDEYDAVMEKWGPLPPSPVGSAPEYSYTFEEDGADSPGQLHGSASISGGVLTLDGSEGGYFSLPDGIFDRRDTFTVSMDVKVDTPENFFFTFGVGNNNSDYLFLRTKKDSLRAALTITGNVYEEGVESAAAIGESWHNYTVVGTPDKLSLYLDGKLIGESAVTKTLYHLGEGLAVNLGKSTWNDPYFVGSYDNVKVFFRALSADEVADLNDIEPEGRGLTVDVSQKGPEIQEDMYGIFFEDINYAADGGMYSEAVKNRSFEAAHCNPDRREEYTKIPGQGWTPDRAQAQYLTEAPLNENNTTYLRLTAQDGGGISNDCYGGFAVHEGESFDASFFARGDYDGKVTVSITDGGVVLGSYEFSGFGGDFEKHSSVIKTHGSTDSATVKLTFDKAGTLDLDMISVMSRDTFNGRDNGLRKDLVQLLADLHPGFVRFPGGCVVEGYYLNNRYSWKDSVGPVENRKENWNRWQTGANAYDYCQTLGIGFYEYFLLCEDIGAKPLPVLSVGIGCQFQSGEVSDWDDLYNIYIQDALDLIDFANGDPATGKWAKVRADMGHPEPFGLEYLGIGNEQWNTEQNRFFERYEAFEEEIHKLYPDIKLISTSGPNPDGADFENAWSWLREHRDDKDFTYAVDEHYYREPEWFLNNVNRYDGYDRNGFGVFAGEYAANGVYGNTVYSALSEAAYMTGLEKNADIVKMASYAPLFAKLGSNQWAPDMIWFNSALAYGSPDYHVQSMFSNNNGSRLLKTDLDDGRGGSAVSAGVGTWRTAAKFRNVSVTVDGQKTALSLTPGGIGSWNTSGDLLSQTDVSLEGAMATASVPSKNYTLELEAMKIGGDEGFLIPFDYENDDNYVFWNIGGWGNTASALQRVVDGVKTTVSATEAVTVDTDRWYSIKIEVEDGFARCYLDGTLVHSQNTACTRGPVYASASEDDRTGDIIVKLVNVGTVPVDMNINIAGTDYINPKATVYTLTGDGMAAANTPDDPDNVTVEKKIFDGAGKSFTYELEGLTFSVLRLHTKEAFAVSSDTVAADLDALPASVPVNMSDGTVENLPVEWRVPKGGAFAKPGVYFIEGRIEGSDVYARASITVADIVGYSVSIEGDKVIFTAEGPAKAIVAAYGANGRLVNAVTRDFAGTLELDLPDAAAEVKAFIWDGELQPLAPPAVKKY